MSALGLDLSLTGTGYAHAEGDGSPRAIGTLKTKTRGAARLALIRDEALALVDIYRPHWVVIEGISYGSPNTPVLAELHGVFKTALWELHRQHPVIVPPSTLKKYVTGTGAGRGKEGKLAVLAAIQKKWGYRIEDDNQGDAYGLARIGLSITDFLAGIKPKDRAEAEALAVIRGSKMNLEVFA